MSSSDPRRIGAQYASLNDQVGVVPLPNRTQLEISGADAVPWLQNVCTNDVKRLAPGEGCEAFITNAQGKTVGYVLLFRGQDGLVLETAAGQAETLLGHFDRYIIREDVQLHDRSSEWSEVLLAGRESSRVLERILGFTPSAKPLAHHVASWGDVPVAARFVEWTRHDPWLISCPAESAASLLNQFVAEGAVKCDAPAFEASRIEQGAPNFGQDVLPDNLPQEAARDRQAISLNKGCYLGQETVARLDALGHVNRTLRGLCFDGPGFDGPGFDGPGFDGLEIPPAGYEVKVGDKIAARVTSSAYSPRLRRPLALAYVRREFDVVDFSAPTPYGVARLEPLPVGGHGE